MNYLAHAYLSFNNEGILVGNMISDYVKGKKKFEYPIIIQKGITLHRAIDAFTDAHSATREAEKLLKPFVGLYAGPLLDVIYDHFLAVDDTEFENDNALMNFTKKTYFLLKPYENLFPEKFAAMFPNMLLYNWLYHYQFNWGIERSFIGVVKRAKYLNDSSDAFKVFEKEYDSFKKYYQLFFPELKLFAKNKMTELLAE